MPTATQIEQMLNQWPKQPSEPQMPPKSHLWRLEQRSNALRWLSPNLGLSTKPTINCCAAESQQTAATEDKAQTASLCTKKHQEAAVETNCDKMQMSRLWGWQTKQKHQATCEHFMKLTSCHHIQASEPTSNERTAALICHANVIFANNGSLPKWLNLAISTSIWSNTS